MGFVVNVHDCVEHVLVAVACLHLWFRDDAVLVLEVVLGSGCCRSHMQISTSAGRVQTDVIQPGTRPCINLWSGSGYIRLCTGRSLIGTKYWGTFLSNKCRLLLSSGLTELFHVKFEFEGGRGGMGGAGKRFFVYWIFTWQIRFTHIAIKATWQHPVSFNILSLDPNDYNRNDQSRRTDFLIGITKPIARVCANVTPGLLQFVEQ